MAKNQKTQGNQVNNTDKDQTKLNETNDQQNTTKQKNELVRLLDFYRTAGYDYVDLIRKDGSCITVVLRDIMLLSIMATFIAPEEYWHEPFHFQYYGYDPGKVTLNSETIKLNKEVNGTLFSTNLHNIVKNANEYLHQKMKGYENQKSKEFNESDALDYLDRYIIDTVRSEGLIFRNLPVTKIVYENEHYIVFQKIGHLKERKWTTDGWNSGYNRLQQLMPEYKLHGSDYGYRLDEFVECYPHREEMKITDKKILAWATSKKRILPFSCDK